MHKSSLLSKTSCEILVHARSTCFHVVLFMHFSGLLSLWHPFLACAIWTWPGALETSHFECIKPSVMQKGCEMQRQPSIQRAVTVSNSTANRQCHPMMAQVSHCTQQAVMQPEGSISRLWDL